MKCHWLQKSREDHVMSQKNMIKRKNKKSSREKDTQAHFSAAKHCNFLSISPCFMLFDSCNGHNLADCVIHTLCFFLSLFAFFLWSFISFTFIIIGKRIISFDFLFWIWPWFLHWVRYLLRITKSLNKVISSLCSLCGSSSTTTYFIERVVKLHLISVLSTL